MTGEEAVRSGATDSLRLHAGLGTVRHPCPCGCGKRLGQCNFFVIGLPRSRQLAPRKVFVAMNKTFREGNVGVKI